MTRPTIRPLSLALVLCFLGFAFAGQSQPLTNDDIGKMIASGFSDDVIISAIAANDTNFDVSVDGLTRLKAVGVSEKVLSAMLAATAHKRDNSAAATAPANAKTLLRPVPRPCPPPTRRIVAPCRRE
jgi:hypothetical protein